MPSLNIPLIKQTRDSAECGLACVQMVTAFFGTEISLEQLKKEIRLYDVGTYAPQLGIFLLDHGYKVELTINNPFLFTVADRAASQDKILKNIQNIAEKNTEPERVDVLRYFIDFMKKGGKIRVAIPDRAYIQKNISSALPMIALGTTNFLTRDTPGYNFHFTVITGIDDEKITINDPGYEYGGEKNILINDLLFALHASSYGDFDNGSLLTISHK